MTFITNQRARHAGFAVILFLRFEVKMDIAGDLMEFLTIICKEGRSAGGFSRLLLAVKSTRFSVLLLTASLSASTITISDSGTFSSRTASSTFSAPDETWSLSFVVDSAPHVSNVNPGNYFDVAFSDFHYFLDGSPVAITPADIRFFNASQFGMFEICFTVSCSFFNNPTDGFAFVGPQMYTGLESEPTILTGTFTPSYAYAYVDTTEFFQAPEKIQAVNTPEPRTTLALGAGLLLIVARRWRQRHVLSA